MHHKAREMLVSQRTQLNSPLRGRLAEIGSSRRRGSKTGAFRNLARLIFTSLYRLAPRVVNALVVVQLSGGIVPVFACMANPGEGLFPGEKNVGGTRRDRDDMNGKRGRPTLVRHNRCPPLNSSKHELTQIPTIRVPFKALKLLLVAGREHVCVQSQSDIGTLFAGFRSRIVNRDIHSPQEMDNG